MLDRHRAKDFVELHDQVDVRLSCRRTSIISILYQTSVRLLDSLGSFLSTFQRVLCPVRCQPSKTIARTSTAVSGAIESVASLSLSSIVVLMLLQRIDRPLSNLISEIAIPPPLAETILDTDVGKPWLVAMPEFEQKLDSLNTRARVKAVRALSEVAKGLRIVVCTVSFWRHLLSFLV